jgi:hypothetical protein
MPSPSNTANQRQRAGSATAIPLQLDRMEKMVSELHNQIGELENRLAMASADRKCDSATTPCEPQPPQSGKIIDRLGFWNNGIEGAVTRLIDIRKRLQL